MKCIKVAAYGATGSVFNGLAPLAIDRPDAPAAGEVAIDILYCGVCHSDLHQVRNDWKNTIYPCVPGHEIVGKVTRVGRGVKKFKVGEVVGVGCMIDSCGKCPACRAQEEQFCSGPVGFTATYNGYAEPKDKKFNTFGGYSTQITVREAFVLKIPKGLKVSAVAPILCAGITTYSPLKKWNVRKGQKVAIVGFGGLGHMAVKLAKAMGAEVTVITTTEAKRKDALKFGAKATLLSTSEEAMKRHEAAFDFILNTIPDQYDINDYVKLLKQDGTIVAVGFLGAYKKPLDNSEVAFSRRNVAGSLIGGVAETQEVLNFCAKHKILPEVEIIPMQDINRAFDALMDREVRYRYVIDMESLRTVPPLVAVPLPETALLPG
jgi:uncharacterized zinc-type alcohol dehydrogenase-like protein